MEEKLTCIVNVAATGTKWIQCILEVIFELMFMEVTSPSRNLVKNLIPFRLWQPNNVFALGLINFKILLLKILSHLHEHKCRHCFQDTLCKCSKDIESTVHFFLHCTNFLIPRQTLFQTLETLMRAFYLKVKLKLPL